MALKVGLLPCSGACNVGMMTTKATIRVIEEDPEIGFVCALGLPLGIERIIRNAQANDRFIALNGCPMKCATRVLKGVGIGVDREVLVLKTFCPEKTKDFEDETGMDRLMETVLGHVRELKEAK